MLLMQIRACCWKKADRFGTSRAAAAVRRGGAVDVRDATARDTSGRVRPNAAVTVGVVVHVLVTSVPRYYCMSILSFRSTSTIRYSKFEIYFKVHVTVY